MNLNKKIKILIFSMLLIFTNISFVFADGLNIDLSLFGINVTSDADGKISTEIDSSMGNLGKGNVGVSGSTDEYGNLDENITSSANQIFKKIQSALKVLTGIVIVCFIGLFIFYLILLGSPTTNENERENYLYGIGWVGFSLAILGSFTTFFFIFIYITS